MEQIKEDMMIPYIGCMTGRMLAKYYNVSPTTVQNRYAYHKETFDKLGVMSISSKEFEELLPQNAEFTKSPDRCMVNYRFGNGFTLSLHTNKNQIYTKEAAEYMSEVIKPMSRGGARPRPKKDNDAVVPSSKVSAPQFSDSEEKKLCLSLAKAFATGDTLKVLNAALDLDTYRICKISDLTAENEKLKSASENRLSWTERSSASKIVKVLAEILEMKQVDVWNKIYYRLTMNYHLPLEERHKLPLIDAVERSEWSLVYQAISEVCMEKYLDMQRIFEKAGVNTAGLKLVIKEEDK